MMSTSVRCDMLSELFARLFALFKLRRQIAPRQYRSPHEALVVFKEFFVVNFAIVKIL